ncbi:MAG: HYR domain-containing protein [Draconibacterium sp.]|nr:HYR domain-containing protein [Draconibacterium sp.]
MGNTGCKRWLRCGIIYSDHASGELFPVGSTLVTYTALDASGNSSNCSFNVIVSDNEVPAIACSGDINECSNTDANVTITAPAVSDNCGILANSLIGERDDNEALTAPYPFGTTTITWTVTDVHNNTNSCVQTVTVNPLPAALAGADRLICFDESTVLGADAVVGSIYSWTSVPAGFTSALANPSVSPLVNTKYTVVETSENGCSNSNSVTVTPNPELVIYELHNDVSCFSGSNGTINITVNGGTGSYNYAWSNGETSEDISGLSAGTYTVTVTDDNECSAELVIEITQPISALQATALITDPILCFGDKATVLVSASGGTPFDEGPLYSGIGYRYNVEPGDFGFGITDANGCIAIATGTIIEPQLLMVELDNQTDVLCQGDETGVINVTASGGTTPYSYAWTGPDDFTSGDEDLNGLSAGIYNLTVTDENECSVTLAAITITEQALPNAGTNGTLTICAGSTVTAK